MKYLKRQYWGMINTALNFPIQSMAASVVTKASIALAKELQRRKLNAKFFLTLHDELCIESSKEHANEVAEVLKDVMENTTKLSVPLTAVPVIGQKYGDLK
jgi:DNA polymerase-1